MNVRLGSIMNFYIKRLKQVASMNFRFTFKYVCCIYLSTYITLCSAGDFEFSAKELYSNLLQTQKRMAGKNSDEYQSAYGLAFITGVIEGYSTGYPAFPEDRFCIPSNVTKNEVVDYLVMNLPKKKYLQNWPATAVVIHLLSDGYPCSILKLNSRSALGR